MFRPKIWTVSLSFHAFKIKNVLDIVIAVVVVILKKLFLVEVGLEKYMFG